MTCSGTMAAALMADNADLSNDSECLICLHRAGFDAQAIMRDCEEAKALAAEWSKPVDRSQIFKNMARLSDAAAGLPLATPLWGVSSLDFAGRPNSVRRFSGCIA